MAIQISESELKAKVEAGWKRDALATHYGLPKQQMSSLLKVAGLKIRKFHAPKWELVKDSQDLNAPQMVDPDQSETIHVADAEVVTAGPGQDW